MGPDQERQVADAVAAHGERLFRAARYLLVTAAALLAAALQPPLP